MKKICQRNVHVNLSRVLMYFWYVTSASWSSESWWIRSLVFFLIEDTTVQKCQPKSQLLFSNRHYQCTCSSMYCINFAVYDLSFCSLTSCSCFFYVYSFFLLKRKGTFHFLFFLFSSCGILKLKEKKKTEASWRKGLNNENGLQCFSQWSTKFVNENRSREGFHAIFLQGKSCQRR